MHEADNVNAGNRLNYKNGGATFLHSGQVGDLILGLPTIRALGGGILHLAPSNHPDSHFPRHVAEQMGTLLRLQKKYIKDVVIWDGRSVEYNLDEFRKGNTQTGNISDVHLAAFGFGIEHRYERWLDNLPTLNVPNKTTVFQRTSRYRNRQFSWHAIYEKYGANAVLVGTRDEHREFESLIGPIDCFVVRDFLEMASLINGAKLFVCNQSCGFAMAEGMKHPNVILEVCPSQPTNLFGRVTECWCYP